jgi:hypothetical protein
MAIEGIDDDTGELILRVQGDVTSPSTWAALIHGCTRAWIRQFSQGAIVQRVPRWVRLKLGLVALVVALATPVSSFAAVDSGSVGVGLSSADTAQIGVGLVEHHRPVRVDQSQPDPDVEG